MRLLIIRHGDPDYSIDGLTEKGKKEVKLLADKLQNEKIDEIYCSPLGRARLTAEPTLERLNMTAEYCDWLREFGYPQITLPYLEKTCSCWDILPAFLNDYPDIYDRNKWREVDFIKNSDVTEAYDEVCAEFDKMLEKHGYLRNGDCYTVKNPNHDTVALFCHFGLTAVLVSHLTNSSPFTFLQNFCTPPTSITTFYTEERVEGVASFRCSSMGDVSHLYAAKEEPAFSGRFCECFTDDTRH